RGAGGAVGGQAGRAGADDSDIGMQSFHDWVSPDVAWSRNSKADSAFFRTLWTWTVPQRPPGAAHEDA
ncbi:hypothetical protein, partial [Achromobacter aegrifaciens]|uniref:hypothetical protein n=1 Tax=Achromobacter aegrifaciens TaxID=1287736 RepID=UPI0028A9AD42